MYLHQNLYKKTGDKHKRQRGDGHPKRDLTLESRGRGVVRVEILAEELACGQCHVEGDEQKHVLHDPQHLVGDTALIDVEGVEPDGLPEFLQKILHRSDGTEIAAEQLAEKHDCRREDNTHRDLHACHRARQ